MQLITRMCIKMPIYEFCFHVHYFPGPLLEIENNGSDSVEPGSGSNGK